MTQDETARVQAIAQRLKDATPGPWEPRTRAYGYCIWSEGPEHNRETDAGANVKASADARLIAHAPQDIAFLLAELDRCVERNARLEAKAKDYEDALNSVLENAHDKSLMVSIANNALFVGTGEWGL